MAFIRYVPGDEIAAEQLVGDDDNILRIHGIHADVIRLHYELYVELMHRPGPLSRIQREMIAVVISAINRCEY